MHKKKNSASVLSGELILTFYKPQVPIFRKREEPVGQTTPEDVLLSTILDKCLSNGTRAFSSEALFNRLIMEMWSQDALKCLSLDRHKFAEALRSRGWSYDPAHHVWAREGAVRGQQPTLFDTGDRTAAHVP